ncbi:hypothetical protein ACA910_005396 [Epithemia clementina (nom. ined.)]
MVPPKSTTLSSSSLSTTTTPQSFAANKNKKRKRGNNSQEDDFEDFITTTATTKTKNDSASENDLTTTTHSHPRPLIRFLSLLGGGGGGGLGQQGPYHGGLRRHAMSRSTDDKNNNNNNNNNNNDHSSWTPNQQTTTTTTTTTKSNHTTDQDLPLASSCVSSTSDVIVWHCLEILLQHGPPNVLFQTSVMTGCNCVHLALRRLGGGGGGSSNGAFWDSSQDNNNNNNNNNNQHGWLLKSFLWQCALKDGGLALFLQANAAGEWPLHVACRLPSLPFSVFETVVDLTTRAFGWMTHCSCGCCGCEDGDHDLSRLCGGGGGGTTTATTTMAGWDTTLDLLAMSYLEGQSGTNSWQHQEPEYDYSVLSSTTPPTGGGEDNHHLDWWDEVTTRETTRTTTTVRNNHNHNNNNHRNHPALEPPSPRNHGVRRRRRFEWPPVPGQQQHQQHQQQGGGNGLDNTNTNNRYRRRLPLHHVLWHQAIHRIQQCNQDSYHLESQVFPRMVLLCNATYLLLLRQQQQTNRPPSLFEKTVRTSDPRRSTETFKAAAKAKATRISRMADLGDTSTIVHTVSHLCTPRLHDSGCSCGTATSERLEENHNPGSSDDRRSMIPQFLLDYLVWKFPQQIKERDRRGQLPIHHAVTILPASKYDCCRPPCCARQSGAHSSESHCLSCMHGCSDMSLRNPVGNKTDSSAVWFRWIQTLLRIYPGSIRVRDAQGRLPLHCFLDTLLSLKGDCAREAEKFGGNANNGCGNKGFLPAFHNRSACGSSANVRERQEDLIILDVATQLLVQSFPTSLEVVDPISGLFPCLQMALCGDVQSTYWLLRANPTVLFSNVSHQREQ